MGAFHADRVTMPAVPGADDPSTTRPSLLPFDPADLMAMRVKPADYARMCQVSRQTVSKWIKKGWVTLGLDGLLDPVVASRQLLSKADPSRLRARVFKDATSTMKELRARILSLETEAADARERAKHMIHTDEIASRMCRLSNALVDRFAELSDAHSNGQAIEWLDLLEGKHLWLIPDDELQEIGDSMADSRETPRPGASHEGDSLL